MTQRLEDLKAALADRYEIEHELGSGGMATVYLAEDVKHHRKIALKVLRPELAAALGPERFLREIEIAANLTHPHILPVHDSGQADGFLYYVMPYVEGESLRERLSSEKQLPLDDSLRIAREVADALSYAHSHDVVHRDIKPENILLESGHAVVADFGIARAITAAGGEKLTETGIAIGTVSYMSPEQASGEQQLDGRSDIYSLGCVLYEMLAGEPPFAGPSSQAVIARKLSDQIPSLHTVRETVPVSIETALKKALAKVPADRFSTADQFAEALTISDSVGIPPVGAPAGGSARRRFGPALVASAAVLVLVGVFGTRMLRPRPFTITTSNIRQVTRDPGLEIDPAISPDGNEVAYVAGPPFQTQLLVRSVINVRGGASRPAADLAGYQRSPRWSPDGQLVRFASCSIGSCTLREVGKLGGSPGTISTPENGRGFSWFQSGDRVAYRIADSIFVASADGAQSELLTVAPAPGQPHSFAWSPDGETVAFVNGNSRWLGSSSLGNVAVSSIWVVSVDGGDPILVTDATSNNQSPAWLPDAKHLLFISDRDGSRAVYVVEVDRAGPVGDPQPITGVSDPYSISVSIDGRRLLYSKFSQSRNIWSLPIRRSGAVGISEGHPLTSGQQIIEAVDLSPAGDSIAYDSNLEGNQDIYKMSLEGGNPVALTDDPADDYYPDWSPDGTQIAFYSTRTGSREIWVMSADGSNEQQLTDMPSSENYFPDWSPDGLKIAFGSCPPAGCEIWVVSRDSVGGNWGEPEQLTVSGGNGPQWTPDGSILYRRGGFRLVSSSGEERLIPTPFFQRLGHHRLSVDGSTIYALATHRDRDVREVWSVPQDGSEPRLVVESDDPLLNIAGYPWAVGTDNIYLLVAEYESDIWVVDLEW